MGEAPHDLPRRLTVFAATSVVIGSIIGSGIFKKAGGIALLLPDPWIVLVMWAVAGLLTLAGALALAELAAMYPRTGGIYVYLKEAYGSFVAFLFGWSALTILQTGSIAGLAAIITDTIAMHVPQVGRAKFIFSSSLVVLLSAVSILSVRAGAGVQEIFTIAKCLGILLLILGGFLIGHGSLDHFQASPTAPSGALLASAFGLAMVKALWAYDGWANVSFVAGEVRDPQKNLPRSLMLGTVFVVLVYLSANAAYHFVLPLDVVQGSENAAVTLADTLIPSSALDAVLMAVLVVISTFGTLNSTILTSPRISFAMAQDGVFPSAVAAVHPRFQTPHVALVLQCVWSLVLLELWGQFETITDNVVFIFWIFYALCGAAVIVLRIKRPDAARPYKVPLYPWLPGLFVVVALWLTYNTIAESLRDESVPLLQKAPIQALALLAAGFVAFPLFRALFKPKERAGSA